MLTRFVRSVILVMALIWSVFAFNVVPASAHAASSPNTTVIAKAALTGQQTCASPPSNFNPWTATDQEIALYGFPKRPTDSQYIPDWVSSISWAKHRDCDGTIHTSKGVVHKKYSTSIINDITENWDGYEEDWNTNFPFIYAARGWYNLNCVSGNGVGYSAWVGIGGALDILLWQAGWDGVARKFWYEQYGGSKDTGGEVQLSFSPSPRCGDQAYTYVDYAFSDPNGTYAYLGDVTLGVYKSVSFNGGQSDEESAEWIDERPSCGKNPNGTQKYWNLGAFDETNWRGDYWFRGDSAYHPITYDTIYTQDVMYDRNGHQLATASAIDSSGEHFTDTFMYSGNDGQC